MTPEMLAHIRADVQTAMVENRNTDPALLPDLLDYLLTELSLISISPEQQGLHDPIRPYEVREWADGLLNQAQMRAISQISFADRSTENDPDWRDHL